MMYLKKLFRVFFLLQIMLLVQTYVYAQEVPILNYSTDENGQVQLEVNSTTDNYYVVNIRHSSMGPFELATSLTLGEEGTTILSERLGAYPQDHYQVLEYSIDSPVDTDGDGLDDMVEYNLSLIHI